MKMAVLLTFSVIVVVFVATQRARTLSVNDILNVNYLPGTLLLDNAMLDGDPHVNRTSTKDVSGGNWSDAFHTMDFHRKMMNEYLCRSFVAGEILSDMGTARAFDRVGSPAPEGKNKKLDLSAVKESMLADPGSSHYKNWLARTTTLEDIYRHYEDLTAEDDGSHDGAKSVSAEYDGEVTGYAAMNHPLTAYGKTGYNGGGGGGGGFSSYGGGSGSGSSTSSSGYSYQPQEKSDKGMALKDLFELALTALAFLAFGLFKLNVIMCIFGGNGSMTTQPEEMAASRVTARERRDVTSTETLNVMSHRVLRSIEVFLAMEYDDGECLKRTLCENNKFSRTMTGTDRIWLPVWSLGLSWVAGRLSPSQHPSAAMLEYLRASILGLGNSQCEVMFPRCDIQQLHKIRSDRRRRRRKKRHGDTGDL